MAGLVVHVRVGSAFLVVWRGKGLIMYDTSGFFRWLRCRVFVCSCLGSAVSGSCQSYLIHYQIHNTCGSTVYAAAYAGGSDGCLVGNGSSGGIAPGATVTFNVYLSAGVMGNVSISSGGYEACKTCEAWRGTAAYDGVTVPLVRMYVNRICVPVRGVSVHRGPMWMSGAVAKTMGEVPVAHGVNQSGLTRS